MLIIKIDVLDAQSAQAVIDTLIYVFWSAIHNRRSIGLNLVLVRRQRSVENITKLRRQKHLIAILTDSMRNQLLVFARTI